MNQSIRNMKKYKSNDSIHWTFLFSYWIFFWFLFYFLTFTVSSPIIEKIQQNFNPLLALYLALIENLVSIGMLIYYQARAVIIWKFLFVVFLFKGIPIYLLRHTKIHWMNDSIIVILLFFLYLFYLYLSGTNISQIYHDTFQHVIKNDTKTPAFSFLREINGKSVKI